MRIFIFAGVLFGLIGIGFLISSVYTAKDLLYFNQQSETGTGKVINIETRAESSPNPGTRATTYSDYAIIELTTTDGSIYPIEKLIYPGQEISVGDELTLHYLPEDPINATFDSFWDRNGWLIISLLFGIVFSVIGFSSLWHGIKDDVNERMAVNYHENIEASIQEVVENYDNPKAKPHYFIIAEGVHPRTSEKMVFKSRRLKSDPSMNLNKTITVKFHPSKVHWYWVDTKGLV